MPEEEIPDDDPRLYEAFQREGFLEYFRSPMPYQVRYDVTTDWSKYDPEWLKTVPIRFLIPPYMRVKIFGAAHDHLFPKKLEEAFEEELMFGSE